MIEALCPNVSPGGQCLISRVRTAFLIRDRCHNQDPRKPTEISGNVREITPTCVFEVCRVYRNLQESFGYFMIFLSYCHTDISLISLYILAPTPRRSSRKRKKVDYNENRKDESSSSTSENKIQKKISKKSTSNVSAWDLRNPNDHEDIPGISVAHGSKNPVDD